jgi:hypothetical protein
VKLRTLPRHWGPRVRIHLPPAESRQRTRFRRAREILPIALDEKLPGNDTIMLAAGWTVLLSVIAHGVTANPLVNRMVGRREELHAVCRYD